MHITRETDYALRIVDCLARSGEKMGASLIANKTNVTLRFSLKILRKLVASGILRSYKGAQGGYEIARPLEQISLNDVLETIEGPYALNRCQTFPEECTHWGCDACPYHNHFVSISNDVRQQLKSVTIASVLQKEQHATKWVENIETAENTTTP